MTSRRVPFPSAKADREIRIAAKATLALFAAVQAGRRSMSVEFTALDEIRTAGGVREIRRAMVSAAAFTNRPEYAQDVGRAARASRGPRMALRPAEAEAGPRRRRWSTATRPRPPPTCEPQRPSWSATSLPSCPATRLRTSISRRHPVTPSGALAPRRCWRALAPASSSRPRGGIVISFAPWRPAPETRSYTSAVVNAVEAAAAGTGGGVVAATAAVEVSAGAWRGRCRWPPSRRRLGAPRRSPRACCRWSAGRCAVPDRSSSIRK